MLEVHLLGKFEVKYKKKIVESQLVSMGMRLLPVDKMEYERNLAHLRAKLDEKAISRFWAKGRGMSLEQAIAFALEEA